MAQFDTKVLANVGFGVSGTSPSVAGGNQGYSGKYYAFTYFVTGLPAAVTSVPIGVAPCPCKFVGIDYGISAATAGVYTVTATPIKIPFDAGGTPVNLCSTNPLLGTGVVAFPAYTNSINFDGSGLKTQAGSNNTTTTTGITNAVISTVSGATTFRQGDIIGITTAGVFTGGVGLVVTVWLQEQNGSY